MRLYLVQHGKALSEDIDPKRPLSEEGKKDTERIAKFLKGKIDLDVIWHSEKLRTKETAQTLAEYLLPKEGLKELKRLLPLDPVESLLRKIIGERKNIMIVSHLPFLQKLSSLILTGSENYNLINFSQAGCVYLEEREEIFGISWVVTPESIF